MKSSSSGPLAGLRVIEMAGIGPCPMAAMQLADMGAEVLRIERLEPVELGVARPLKFNLLLRNRRAVALDLKDPRSIALVLELLDGADALIEGFRPGVMERLGLGPDTCLARNPKLVYGRVTGWGQHGPLAQAAGHDINYLAVTGVLDAIGRRGQAPSVPLAVVGDFAGGALYLAMGVLAALLNARQSGRGQVVDASIADGVSNMATAFHGLHAAGLWQTERGSNLLDSGAPFYDVYECSDGRWISIGPLEARFHRELLRRLGLAPEAIGDRLDRTTWPRAREIFAAAFKKRTRDAWCELLEGTDACFAPVLSFAEAPQHAHLEQRESFVEIDGVRQPAPSPRFSATPSGLPTAPEAASFESLADWLPPERREAWRASMQTPPALSRKYMA